MKKKVFALSFVAALSIFGTALANCLWIDEKSKDYTADAAINEINNSITTRATAEMAEKLRTNEGLRMLFKASEDLPPEKMQEAYSYVKYLKSKEPK